MNKVQQEQYEILCNLLEKRGFSMLDGHYVNAKTKINIECDQGHQYTVTAESIKNNRSCAECRLSSGPKGRIEKIVRDRDGKLLSEYKNMATKLKIECSEGHVWEMLPVSIEKGSWCPECKKNNYELKVLECVTSRRGKIIRERLTSEGKYLLECQKGHQWETRRSDIIDGHWCPKCSMRDPEDAALRFQVNIEEKGGTVLGTYVNNATKVLVRCINDHEYLALPITVYQGKGCKKCTGKDFESCSQRLQEYVASRNGTLLTEYEKSDLRVELKCKKGHVWMAKPNTLIARRSWCPRCNESKGEEEVLIALDELGIDCTREFQLACTGSKRYDFCFNFDGASYILEFDGKQHFKRIGLFHKTDSEFEYRQNVDRLKTYVALNLGYKVIRIDWYKIGKVREIIIKALQSECNLYLSESDMYIWLLEGLPRSFLQSNCDTSELAELADNEIILLD